LGQSFHQIEKVSRFLKPEGRFPIEIVPVIDLKQGQVVRARAGERDRYVPIVTPLSPTSDPVDVARGLLAVTPASHLYVADLDAIEGGGHNLADIRRLAEAFPEMALWVDAGTATLEQAQAFLKARLGRLVLGSESQVDTQLLKALAGEVVLSLDFRGERFVGPRAIWDNPPLWPDTVIVMTLARVGTGTGPDLDRLRKARQRAPRTNIYAAGGLRGPEDMARLADIGVAGVLVASALHDGRLDGRSIHTPTSSSSKP
jgi:phosphoribosylformimino-5-aminoimidazole carboxamide ribotide isomerase